MTSFPQGIGGTQKAPRSLGGWVPNKIDDDKKQENYNKTKTQKNPGRKSGGSREPKRRRGFGSGLGGRGDLPLPTKNGKPIDRGFFGGRRVRPRQSAMREEEEDQWTRRCPIGTGRRIENGRRGECMGGNAPANQSVAHGRENKLKNILPYNRKYQQKNLRYKQS